MNKENCALKLVDEIILYYDARSKKHQITSVMTAVLQATLENKHREYILELYYADKTLD